MEGVDGDELDDGKDEKNRQDRQIVLPFFYLFLGQRRSQIAFGTASFRSSLVSYWHSRDIGPAVDAGAAHDARVISNYHHTLHEAATAVSLVGRVGS